MTSRWLIASTTALVVAVGGAVLYGVATSGSDPAASLEQLREEEVLFLDEHNIFLVYNEGDPLALLDDPQHLDGEHTEWCESSQLFETPTHGEKFDRRGNYYGGPAAKGLDRYPVRIEGDGLYIDLDQLIPGPERGAEKPLEPLKVRSASLFELPVQLLLRARPSGPPTSAASSVGGSGFARRIRIEMKSVGRTASGQTAALRVGTKACWLFVLARGYQTQP